MSLGYADPGYVASLADFGEPLRMPASGGWLLRREIGAGAGYDAIAPYPLLQCSDWHGLANDLARLRGRLVSVAAAIDPLAELKPEILRAAFPQGVLRMKDHWVRDLDADHALSAHHARNLRRARVGVTVTESTDPAKDLNVWTDLYAQLAHRHGLEGIRRFSRAAFERQLRLPCLLAFRAEAEGRVVAMMLWTVAGRRAYFHLGASAPAGYDLRASYALMDASLESLRARGLESACLGGGTSPDGSDGLARFKRGWATRSVSAYLGCAVLDDEAYTRLSPTPGPWFPAYRAGERDLRS